MRRLLVIPVMSAAIVVCVVASSVAGAGAAPGSGDFVAKTTIGPAPSPTEVPGPSGPTGPGAVPTAPVPTVPAPTVSVPPLPGAIPTLPPATVDEATTEEDAGLSPESVAIALPIFGLDAAKLQCVDAALPPFASDDEAALAALQGCGVALMPLLRGVVDVAQRSTVFLDPTATTIALPAVPGADALDEGDAFYLGFMLLLSQEQLSCLATGLSGVTSEDDATALAIMQRCDVSLALILDMLTFALVGDLSDPTATTMPVATAPVVSTPALPTVPAVPTTVGPFSPDDPLVDQFQEMLLEQEGITLDDQQAACLLSSIGAGGFDEEDLSALFEVMESCGITLVDLVPNTTAALRPTARS